MCQWIDYASGMKSAVIFSIPDTTSKGFAWRWRSDNYLDDLESSDAFDQYYECVADAEARGYTVSMAPAEPFVSGV